MPVDFAVTEDFIKNEGALFKRKPEGGYDGLVYCPRCRKSTDSMLNKLPFYCSYCHWTADFDAEELAAIMKTLPDAPAC